MLQLNHRKGNEIFIFRWGFGEEKELIELFEEQANDPAINFDIYDAAYLSIILIDHLIAQADALLDS